MDRKLPPGSVVDIGAASQLLLGGLAGVRDVRLQKPSELGEGIATLTVSSDADIRDVVCRTLVEKGYGILELSRAERELEQAFLQLLSSGRSSANEALDDEANDAAESEEDSDEDDDTADDAPVDEASEKKETES